MDSPERAAAIIKGATDVVKAPAVIRGSQCPDIVMQIAALRDMLDSHMVEDLMRAAASIRTSADEAAMRTLLLEVRANPRLFSTPKENRAQRRYKKALSRLRERRH